jgi:hypothetical protein
LGSHVKEAPGVRRGEGREAAEPEEVDSHLRYALRVGAARKDAEYVGHSGGCLGTPLVPFEQARIWARKQDANNYLKHPNVKDVRKKLELAEIACIVGRPFAVYME